jgi:hypothetical protein
MDREWSSTWWAGVAGGAAVQEPDTEGSELHGWLDWGRSDLVTPMNNESFVSPIVRCYGRVVPRAPYSKNRA